MKQLRLDITEHRKQFIRTDKNIALMKECYATGYREGWVGYETYRKVLNYRSGK